MSGYISSDIFLKASGQFINCLLPLCSKFYIFVQKFIERHNRQPEGPREDNDLLRCIKTKPDDSLKLELERSVAELTSTTKETPMDTMPDFDIGHDDMLDLGSEDAVVSNQCKIQSIDNRDNIVYPEATSRLHSRLEGSTSEQESPRQPMHPITQYATKSSTSTKPLPSSRAPETKVAGRHLQGEAVGGGSFGGFRTAQQQMILDRQKAGSKGNRGNTSTSRGWEGAEGITCNSYGGAGRTLGTRPGPATGFKPPVRQVTMAFLLTIICRSCHLLTGLIVE